ncbi:hypothetical protein EJ02DRAFT_345432 [Clathrospora elynae]|uniref:Uncharacterized protein n=1 Tax=Clathrospora elynae TaxID=706981 RepID=A0A6A5SPK2_9PLEO|nr:hypothetical protein EJ02DRAFT_345432 [Clathrospora elynae]
MVACANCALRGLGRKMLSLLLKCRNCFCDGKRECCPVDVPVPDFSKIDEEMKRLEAQENAAQRVAQVAIGDAQKVASAARKGLHVAHSRLARLRKQWRLLKRKEQEIFNDGCEDAEVLEVLKDMEYLNQQIASVNAGAPAEAHAVD